MLYEVITTALSLVQIGEFSLAILELARSGGLLSSTHTQILIVTIVISMIITPIILKNLSSLAASLVPDDMLIVCNTHLVDKDTVITSYSIHYTKLYEFLASYLSKKSFKTVHYSSPHILKFNERIWLDGRDSSDLELEIAHKTLQDILDTYLLEKLTYFEYTTLLALVLSSSLDYLVLEAGLGGEFDATNVA